MGRLPSPPPPHTTPRPPPSPRPPPPPPPSHLTVHVHPDGPPPPPPLGVLRQQARHPSREHPRTVLVLHHGQGNKQAGVLWGKPAAGPPIDPVGDRHPPRASLGASLGQYTGTLRAATPAGYFSGTPAAAGPRHPAAADACGDGGSGGEAGSRGLLACATAAGAVAPAAPAAAAHPPPASPPPPQGRTHARGSGSSSSRSHLRRDIAVILLSREPPDRGADGEGRRRRHRPQHHPLRVWVAGHRLRYPVQEIRSAVRHCSELRRRHRANSRALGRRPISTLGDKSRAGSRGVSGGQGRQAGAPDML